MEGLNSRQSKTLTSVFAKPPSGNIKWAAIESLLRALGAKVSEGQGSRVRFYLNGRIITIDRPHPRPTAGRGLVERVRDFLEKAGVTP